jgi:NAD+ synthase
MRPAQAKIIATLNVQATIDPATEIERRIGFLVDYLTVTGASGLVLGISGGQDSSLAGRLCQLAIERLAASRVDASDAPPRFVAVRLPYAVQADEDDAQLALSFVQPSEAVIFDIKRAVDGFQAEYGDRFDEPMLDFTKGNVKARARMIAQYAISGQDRMLVVGTDHAAEAVTGFFTKFGDGGADILPLSGLTKRQGRALLEHLGAPERLYLKAPTADLLDDNPGQTDEANLGLSYRDIDDYLEGHEVPDAIASAIEDRYLVTEHKRAAPVTPFDTWWRRETDPWAL